MKKLFAPFLLLSVAALVGCAQQTPYYESYGDEGLDYLEPEEWVDYGNLDLVGGHLAGDIGDVRGLDQTAQLRNGYDDTEYATIEVHAENQNGSAMNLLEVWGGLDRLAPGTRQTFRPEDATYEPEDLSVQVIGCSGPSTYDWQYDQPADEVEVLVGEGDEAGVTRIDYTARTFRSDPFTGLPSGQADVVTGSVDIRR